MNILVTGANGQLGNEMRIVSKDTNDSYTFTDVVKAEGVETTILDITDADAVRSIVKEKDIQCIVNCAAYTNVDKAESDEALCRKLNADALKMGTIATAKEAERSIVDIETLKKTNAELIQTLDDVMKIQQNGRTQRLAAEAEMAKMESDLKNKLLQIRSGS